MPIDPRIPLMGQAPPPGPSILDTYQQVQQIQGQREQTEVRRLAAEAAKRADESVTRLRAATRIDPATGQVTVDYPSLIGHVDPDKLANVQAAIARTAQEQQQLATTTATADEKKRAYLAGLAQITKDSGYDPQIFADATTLAAAAGYLSPKEAESAHAFSRDDAFRKSVVDRAIDLGPPKPPAALERVTTVDDQGREVTQFVTPTAGSSYPTAPKAPPAQRALQAKDVLLDGRPTLASFDPDTGTYHVGGEDVTARVRPIPPQASGGGGGQRPITQTAEAGLISRLNSQWTTATKGPRELAQQLTTMRAGLAAADRGDMAQGTEAVLQPFLKILDPNSVVREGEFFRLREGQSYIARAKGILQRLTQGGFVPLAELKKYAALAEEIAKRQDSYVAGVRGRIGKVAERYGIPEELVFETGAPIQDTSTTPAAPAGGLTYDDYLRSRGQQ